MTHIITTPVYSLLQVEAAGQANIYVRLSAGPNPLGVFDDDVARLVKHCRDRSISNVLIECVADPLSNTDGYKVISSLADRVPSDFKVAIAASSANNRKRFSFGLRSVELDGLELKVFDGVEVAQQWLLH